MPRSVSARLIGQSLIAELEASGVKFTREDVIFTARDSTGQIVWLEKGSKAAGYAHLESRGHVGQIAKKFGVSESEVPRLLRNIIRDGRIVSNETRKTTVERAASGFANTITSVFFLRAWA